MVFGLTGKASRLPGHPSANVPFKVVATQPGIRPDAVQLLIDRTLGGAGVRRATLAPSRELTGDHG